MNPNDPEEVESIRALRPRAYFSFYYRDLLRRPLLEIPPHGGVNVHGSLLPRYRGRAPVNWQILHGETQSGATLHYMVARADAGDIVDQEPFPIGRDDTPVDVYRRLVAATERVLERSARAVVEGRAPRRRQLESMATKFGRRRPEDGRIDWRLGAEDIRNLARAVTHPYPGAFTFAGGERVGVWWAETVGEDPGGEASPAARVVAWDPPGTLRHEPGGLTVACGGGQRLRLVRIEMGGDEGEAARFADRLADGIRLGGSNKGDDS